MPGCLCGLRQTGTGSWGRRGSPPAAGRPSLTLDASLSPWGLSFPELAKGADGAHSSRETTGGSPGVWSRWCWEGPKTELLQPSAGPGPRPRLGLSSWTKGKFQIPIQAPYRASKSEVKVQISALPLLGLVILGTSLGLSELQCPK